MGCESVACEVATAVYRAGKEAAKPAAKTIARAAVETVKYAATKGK